MRSRLIILWNDCKLRWWVFLYLFPLRLHLFNHYVSELEAMRLRQVRRDLWQLTLSGEVRREMDEDGEYRYYPPDK